MDLHVLQSVGDVKALKENDKTAAAAGKKNASHLHLSSFKGHGTADHYRQFTADQVSKGAYIPVLRSRSLYARQSSPFHITCTMSSKPLVSSCSSQTWRSMPSCLVSSKSKTRLTMIACKTHAHMHT